MRDHATALHLPTQPQPVDDGFALPDGSSVRRHGDSAEIRDAAGRVIVRYHNGSASICVPEGDLTLEAPKGHVRLKSGADVVIEAEGTLRQQAHALITKAERYELVAERIVERAQDALRDVSGFAEQRVGRLSTIVRDLYTVASRRTSMRSEKDTSIDGTRIRLG